MSNVQNFFEKKAKTGEWKDLYDLKNPSSYPFVIRLQKTQKMLEGKVNGKKVLKSNQKTILLVIYNSQNQRRYIGIKLD